MAEFYRGRVAAVFTADTAVNVRTGLLTELYRHFHELAYADLVELCERIALVDLGIVVSAEELAGLLSCVL